MSRLLALLACLPTVALASPEDDALACVRTKAWEAQAEGWSIKSLRAETLGPDGRAASVLTLYPGRTYRVLGCGTDGVTELDLVLYDAQGHVALRDTGADRQPSLDTGERSGTFVLAAHVRAAAPGSHGVGVAVLHR